MATSEKDSDVDLAVTASKFRESFFGKAAQQSRPRSKSWPRRRRSKSLTRNCPDDPIAADEYTSCRVDEPVRLQLADKGALAQKPLTIMTALQMTADRYHDNDAFAVKVGGKWEKTKLRDMYRMIRTTAKAFIRLGLTRFRGVGIMGYNAPEWVVSCLAAIFAGGVAVGIHYSHPVEDCKRLALLVKCNIIVVDSADDLAKILEIRYSLPDLKAIVQFGKDRDRKTDGVTSWDEMLKMGEQVPEDRLKECILAQAPNYACMITFTMGRTGPPKTVMVSHDNLIWTAKVFGKYQSLSNSGGAHVSFHPLSNPVGALMDIFVPLIFATTVYFVPRELVKKNLVDVMREVHPTFFMTIPFFYERIYDHIQMSLQQSAVKNWIFKSAMNLGRQAIQNAKDGKRRPCCWWLANHFIFKGVQRKLGLDRCIEVHSAGNFMLPRTAEFFNGLNMHILNNYGSSEVSGPHSISLPDRHRAGSCGVEMDGCRTRFVKIDNTSHTEMRVKGRNIFMGYLNDPEKTEEAFDADGWFKTRDMGYRDDNGFLWITGTMDDLFTLSTGQVVHPIPIETAIVNELPFIGRCVVCGNDRPYVAMLLTFNALTDDKTFLPLDVVSMRARLWLRKNKIDIEPISLMADNPPKKLVYFVQSAIDEINAKAVDSSSAVRKWKFLPRDFSVPTGELNPSYRMKRHVILELYAIAIESMYDGR